MSVKRLLFAIAAFCLVLVSCNRQKDVFVLDGTLQDGSSDSILVFGFDSRFERTDTIRCSEGRFQWSFRPDTVTTLILALPDGRQFPVFAEKNVTSQIFIPSDSGRFVLKGGACNDAFQSFYMAAECDTTLEMITARVDSFIVRDPFSEVTPYILYEYVIKRYHGKAADINALTGKMSGNMQDTPFLTALKSELRDDISDTYMSTLSLRDSAGNNVKFTSLESKTILCCLWGSWDLERGLEARKTLKGFAEKYADRKLMVTDISIDMNFDRWKRAISGDTLDWKSYIDLDGWESRIVKSASAKELPVYIIFSDVKRLTYKTTSTEELDIQLDRTLTKPIIPKSEGNPVKAKKAAKKKLILNL